jgi:opacity protein-like surface antigen
MTHLRPMLPLVLVLTLSSTARSQEYHEWEIFGGFDYLNAKAGSITLSSGQTINLLQNAYGWHITATENKASWFGGIIDVSGDYASRTINVGTPSSPFNVRFNGQAYPILFGPRFYLRRFDWVTLFGEPMMGLVVARINVASTSEIPELAALLPETKTHWAYALGGGADYELSDRFAIRVQADWIRSDSQNNYRIGGGLVFKFR